MKSAYQAPRADICLLKTEDAILVSGIFDTPVTDAENSSWGELIPMKPKS